MRVVIGFFLFFATLAPAYAECRTVEKYYEKLGSTISYKQGDRHCIVRDWMTREEMVLGYWMEGETLNIVVNNLSHSTVFDDITYYGFDETQGEKVAEWVDEAKQVRFVKMYDKMGIPNIETKKMEYRR